MPYGLMYGSIYIGSSIFNVFNVTMNNIVTRRRQKYQCSTIEWVRILNNNFRPDIYSVADLGVRDGALATRQYLMSVSLIVYLIYMFF